MRAPPLVPDLTSAFVIVCVPLFLVLAAVVVMSGIRALSAGRRRAAQTFAEAAATGRLALAEREAARVLSRNDR